MKTVPKPGSILQKKDLKMATSLISMASAPPLVLHLSPTVDLELSLQFIPRARSFLINFYDNAARHPSTLSILFPSSDHQTASLLRDKRIVSDKHLQYSFPNQ